MKKLSYGVLILFVLGLSIIGCQKDSVKDIQKSGFFVEKIDGKFVFTKPVDVILSTWEDSLRKDVKDISFNEIEIFEFEENYYLRGIGEKYVSTILLGFTGNKGQGITVTCTSASCSNTGGCMPTDNYQCTTCIWGDCTRSVTKTSK